MQDTFLQITKTKTNFSVMVRFILSVVPRPPLSLGHMFDSTWKSVSVYYKKTREAWGRR